MKKGEPLGTAPHDIASLGVSRNMDTRWRGYNLTEQQLPTFLLRFSSEIDRAWQTEYHQNGLLTVDSYRRVASTVGRVADKVRRAALAWYGQDNPARKEIGKKILVTTSFPGILSSIDRVNRTYTDTPIDQEALMECGIIKTLEVIEQAKIGEVSFKNIPPVIDSEVFRAGEIEVAKALGLPWTSWAIKNLHQNIPAFQEEFLSQHQRPPTPEEVATRFGLKTTDEYIAILDNFMYPQRNQPEPFVGDKDVLDAPISSEKILIEQVDDILELLSPRERRILEKRLGLIDGTSKTQQQIGDEENLTRQRIQQIETKALRKLRKPSRGKNRIQ